MLYLPRLFFIVGCLMMVSACDQSGSASTATSTSYSPNSDQSATKGDTSISPDVVLQKFIDASIQRDYGTRYDLLSLEDQAVKSRQTYIDEMNKRPASLADPFFNQIQYQIDYVEESDDTADIKVSYNAPDVEKMIKDTFNVSVLKQQSETDIEDMKQKLEERYSGESIPMKQTHKMFHLVQQGDGWRVRLGWTREG